MEGKSSPRKLLKASNKEKDEWKGFSFSHMLINSQNLRVYTAENLAKNKPTLRNTSW